MSRSLIEVSEDEATAIRCLAFWWACIEADRDLAGEEPLADAMVVLHYCANGCTALVTAGHLRDLRRIDTTLPGSARV